MTQQHRTEQLQLSSVLERFPHYAMVLNAEDLTIHAVNPAYHELLGNRDVINHPVQEIFIGKDLDEFVKILKKAAQSAESVNTAPIQASVSTEANTDSRRFVHTIVPISDANNSNVTRLFVYSEGVK